jgi:hypothetical protein
MEMYMQRPQMLVLDQLLDPQIEVAPMRKPTARKP